MRRNAMVRPAERGLLASCAFAAMLVLTISLSATVEIAHAQSAPDAELSDGFAPPNSKRPPEDFIDPVGDGEPDGGNDRQVQRQPRGSHGGGAPASAQQPAGASGAAMSESKKLVVEPRSVVAPPAAPASAAPAVEAAAPQGGVPAAEGAPAGPGTPAVAGSPDGMQVAARHGPNDIYGQWAKKKLRNERGLTTDMAHPLAIGYPEHFVVVCEAGCPRQEAKIVYLELRSARGPVFKTDAENTNSETDHVACVGGCYKTGLNVPLYEVNTLAASVGAGGAGSWMTTTTEAEEVPAAAPRASGGRWYERINGNSEPDAEASTN